MKKRFILMTLIMTLIMIATSVSSVFADADKSKAYDYTIRVYAGAHGEFADGSKEVTVSVKPGENVNISQIASDAGFKVTDDEYYCRGYRETGHDNDESPSLVAFRADEDVAYEAAYGIKGGMVKYTILYLDADRVQLRESEEFYGMVGDKPVVSYRYVEGYHPQAINLTKTLSENEEDNVFTFTYSQNPERTVETETVIIAGGGTGNNNNANGQQAGNAGGNAAGDNAGANEPADIIDLDDGDTPLAEDADNGEDGTADIEDSETPAARVNPLVAGAIAAVVAAAAAVAAIFAKRRRESEEEE